MVVRAADDAKHGPSARYRAMGHSPPYATSPDPTTTSLLNTNTPVARERESGQFQCMSQRPSIHHPSIHPSCLTSRLPTSSTPFHLVLSADSNPPRESVSQALGAVFQGVPESLSLPNRCSTVHPPTGHWSHASWNTSTTPFFLRKRRNPLSFL